MKPIFVLLAFFFLAACANEPAEQNHGPTKAEVQAREDFASTLPKPRDH